MYFYMKFKKELYRVSEYSYPNVVVTIIIIDHCISPNAKLIRTTEVQLTLDFIK